MTTLGSRLSRASIVGVLVVVAALFWVDGPLSTFAQTDTTSPTVSSVAVTSDTGDDGVYGIGDGIEVTVTFSENVAILGNPQLELTIGSSARNAAYQSTTGSKVVFSYTVVVDDSDTDGISIAADNLNLKGGAIKDLSGNPADLSHSALSAQSGHKVDGIRPTITSVHLTGSSSNQDGVHTIDEYLPAGMRFSEHVYVGGYPGPQMRLNFEGATKSADFLGAFPQCTEPICVSGFGGRYGISVDFDYMIAKGDLDLDGVAINANSVALNGGSIRDGAGNDAVLTHSAVAEDPNYIVDGVPATIRSVAITSDPGSDNTYGVGDTVEVTVTFSESVRAPRLISSGGVVRMPLLELNVGGVAKIARTHERSVITGTALVFSYTVQDGDDDANGISISANKLTTYNSHGITDNYSGCCPGGNKADLHHSAVADDSGHKVATSASPKSTDATLSGLTLSGVNIGTFASDTTSYTADVANSVTETTVTPTVNDSGATYVIKLGGVTDADGTVSLAVGSNVITVVVTAEDDSTTKTYTVTVTRAAASISAPDLTVPSLLTFTNPYGYDPSFSLSVNVVNQGSGSSGSTTLHYYRSADSTITSGDTEVGTDAVGGLAASGRSSEGIDLTAPSAPGTYYYGACVDAVSNESDTTNNCSGGIAFIVPAETSTDATLSGLSLSDVNFGTFASSTTAYTASVANSVTETTVTPTVNDSGASYVIKLGGVTDADGTVSLAVGSNVITVVVTAEDDSTTRTYTVTATRAAPPSTDATLKALSLSGLSLGTFASGTTSYTAQVAYSVSQTTVTPTVNHAEARYVIKLGGVTDANGVIPLSVGRNVITVEVTAEDGETTETYTVTVTRAAPSTDATLRALTLSSIDFGTFASGTASYSARVANSVSQTTVTPKVGNSEASYVIKVGGVTDADGIVPLSVGSNVITVVVTAEDGNTTQTYTVTVTRAAPPSTDASLRALTLSGIGFGTFDSTTISYTATVANSVSQTTVTPTVNDSGASYVIKLGGATDADGTVPLSVGGNIITVEVTAEDTTTTQTYTVTVTRAVPPSTDATLKALSLSGLSLGTFASGTTSYSAQVANSVSQTTVTPTVNDLGASYVIKLDGVTDVDATVTLSVGSNVVTVVVTAADDDTTRTYTVTVTRAEPLSTDATLSALSLSDINIGIFASGTTSYTADVANSVSLTNVTPTLNDSDASYVIKLGGVTDADGTVSLTVGSNVITIEVTAEDDSTTKTYTVTVTRAAASTSAPDLDITFVYTFTNPWGYSPSFTLGVNVENQGSGSSGSTTLRYYRSTDSAITSGDAEVGTDAVDGLAASGISRETIDLIAPPAPGTYYYGACVDAVSNESDTTNNCSGGIAFVVPGVTSTDATLSGLSLSDVNFGTFASGTTAYSADVANSVTETTVTPTVNYSEATYAIKLGGATDADGVVSLAEGSNVITIEVTAEDDITTRTYTVTVTRLVSPQQNSTDATLSALTLSGINFGAFSSDTDSYTASVAYSVTETTVTPTVNDSGATYVIKLGGVTDADGVVSLSVGSNVITVEVTAEDGETTEKYTATVTRAAPSTDATLSALTLSGIDFGTFVSGTASYSAQVANSVSQTTVTPKVGNSEASYVIKVGGVTDADGIVPLSVGSNVITVVVTAEDGNTTKTYTVTVTRDATPSADASLKALTLSGIDFGTFDSTTASYTTTVANSVTETTVTPTVNDSGATYVIKLSGVTDADGVVSLSVGSNVITLEVTAEDDSTTKTYTVTVTRAAASISAPDLTVPFVYTSTSPFGYSPSFTLGVTVENQGSGSSGSTTLRYYRSADSAITSGDAEVGTDAVDGLAASGVSRETIDLTAPSAPGTYYYGACVDAVSDESDATNNCSGSVAFTVPAETSTDATLSGLSLSDVNFGTFASGTTSYSASVANSVSQTTVTPTVNDSEATYVIKLGGVTDADGEISLAVGSNVITIEVTAEDTTTTQTYTVTVTRAAPPSTDGTLSALTLSDVNFGTFASSTTSFTASVAYSVSQTTVTPTVNHSGASYVIKLGGVTDADGTVSLSVGSNVITIEVTAEDTTTTQTYTVTVTRATPPSTDANLKALSLSGLSLGTFASGTTSYTAQVAYSVSQTTVTPTVNHSGASYVIKLGGVQDADGVVSLSLGSNVITIEVTAEDDDTTQTYTVTVARALPSTDAKLSALTLSGIDFGTFVSATTSYSAQVANSVSQTTITPTVTDSEASYVIKLGGVTDADGVVSLSVGSNVITVEVTAEDDNTTRTYTVAVTRAEPPSTDATLSALTLSGIDFGTFDSTTTSYSAQVANSVSQTTVTPTVNDPGASYVIKLGGVEDADGEVSLSVGSNVVTVNVTAEDTTTTQTYTVTVTRAAPASTDATLKALSLSGLSLGTFASGTTSYSAQVANSVSQTTVTPTVNDLGASYVIKLDGVTDVDATVTLSVGNNVITVEVTAEDDNTTQTYTVTVTRAEPPTPELSSDATLRALTLSGMDFGIFDSTTTSYTTTVVNSVSQTTVNATVNDSEATYVIKLGGVTDADGVVSLSVGSNVITVEVTAEDDSTSQTYTVTVTRAAPPSTDATLSALTLSGIDFGTFDSTTASYTTTVTNSVTQTTVTPTVNHSGASYVIKLGGATDADGTVSLSVGSNGIAVVVTAEDDSTSQTYTVTVTRAAPLSSDPTLSALTLSGIDFGTFDSSTTSYTAQVANSVSETTVTPTVNDSKASYVVKLGGATDADGTVSLSVGSNVVTVVVTAEDDSTSQTYTVTVTRGGLPTEETEEETEQRLRVRYDDNENGAIDKDEVLTAIIDYLFDGLITRDEVLVMINMYLFG